MTMIAQSTCLDQSTLSLLIEGDVLCQRVRAFFDLLDWSLVPENTPDPHQRGPRGHPARACIKALLLKLSEQLVYCTTLRRYLVEHPLLVLALGFTPVLDASQP